MAYCTISEVNQLVPQSPFTATTTPTQSQVEAFVTDIADVIEASLGNLGYVVPVTGDAQALRILKRLNSMGALGLALQVRLTAVAPDLSIQNNVWTLRFDKWLTALKDAKDPFELKGAPRTGLRVVKPLGEIQADAASNSVDSGTATDPANYVTAPVFSIGMKF